MKKMIFVLFLLLSLLSQAQNSEQMSEIELRVSELELLNKLNKFHIGGRFINHGENYNEVSHVDKNHKEKETISIASTTFELDINFDLTQNLHIYSRLGMSKFWNHENTPDSSDGYARNDQDDTWDTSNAGSRAYWGSTPKFDRAYMAYKFNQETTTFAIGRMPTYDGPPSHQADGLSRQGTYPRFVYNAIFDGMALSYDFKNHLPQNHILDLRLFYTPFVNISEESRTDLRAEVDSSGEMVKAKSLTPQFTFQADYQIKDLGYADKMIFTYFYYNYDSFYQYVPGDDLYLYFAQAHMVHWGLNGVNNTGLNMSYSHLFVESKEEITGLNEYNQYHSEAKLVNVNYKTEKKKVYGMEYIFTDREFYIDDFAYLTISDFYRVPNSMGYHYFYSFPVFDLTQLRLGLFDYKTRGTFSVDADTSVRDVKSYYMTMTTVF